MSEPFDSAALLASVDGDKEFLADTVAMLTEDGPAQLARLDAGLAAGNVKEVADAAHTLKGMISNFQAEPARLAAYAIEQLARRGSLQEVPAASKKLHAELNRLIEALTEFVKP